MLGFEVYDVCSECCPSVCFGLLLNWQGIILYICCCSSQKMQYLTLNQQLFTHKAVRVVIQKWQDISWSVQMRTISCHWEGRPVATVSRPSTHHAAHKVIYAATVPNTFTFPNTCLASPLIDHSPLRHATSHIPNENSRRKSSCFGKEEYYL